MANAIVYIFFITILMCIVFGCNQKNNELDELLESRESIGMWSGKNGWATKDRDVFFDIVSTIPLRCSFEDLLNKYGLGHPTYKADIESMGDMFNKNDLDFFELDYMQGIITNERLELMFDEIPRSDYRGFSLFQIWLKMLPSRTNNKYNESWYQYPSLEIDEVWIFVFRDVFSDDKLSPVAWFFFVRDGVVVMKSDLQLWKSDSINQGVLKKKR